MSDMMTQEDAINMSNEHAVQILIPMRNMMCDQHGCPISDAVFALDKAIEALSADRPQGEWKPFDLTWGRSIYACSVCEEAIAVPCGWSDGKPIYDYCPMCGAKMKGAINDTDGRVGR